MKYDDLDDKDGNSLRNSMSFPDFLQHALLPSWFPLCNTNCKDTNKLFKTFRMKDMNNDINIDVTDDANVNSNSNVNVKTNTKTNTTTIDLSNAKPDTKTSTDTTNTKPVKMKPRKTFRVGIVGGGLAGLSTALELLRMADTANENLDIEVVIMEAQDSVGGRLKTDRDTFQTVEKERGGSNRRVPFPVDLGAGWIHGISQNPLADLAKEAGIECVRASEDVKMLAGNMEPANEKDDVRIGEIFNSLLDQGVSLSVD